MPDSISTMPDIQGIPMRDHRYWMSEWMNEWNSMNEWMREVNAGFDFYFARYTGDNNRPQVISEIEWMSEWINNKRMNSSNWMVGTSVI